MRATAVCKNIASNFLENKFPADSFLQLLSMNGFTKIVNILWINEFNSYYMKIQILMWHHKKYDIALTSLVLQKSCHWGILAKIIHWVLDSRHTVIDLEGKNKKIRYWVLFPVLNSITFFLELDYLWNYMYWRFTKYVQLTSLRF